MGVNTKYKDSVFSFLFSDPDTLRELYCALENVELPDSVPVTINTLRDVLYMDMVNDISFEIGGRLVVLIEHQSTVNPNMALRLLMYVARLYEKTVGDGKNIYGTRPVPVPRPEFFVLYNGAAPQPPEKTLKLSDAFGSVADIGLPEKGAPALELEVRVLNINEGVNTEMAGRSKTLSGYSAFVARAREFGKGFGDKAEAMKKAVQYCLDHDILKEFLEKHAAEVTNMLVTEWNWDDALAVRYEEGMEKGFDQGIKKGVEKGIEQTTTEFARKMKARNRPIEEIAEDTGLSPEVIEKL